jgi:proliferating cell nuclear antigen PCNA
MVGKGSIRMSKTVKATSKSVARKKPIIVEDEDLPTKTLSRKINTKKIEVSDDDEKPKTVAKKGPVRKKTIEDSDDEKPKKTVVKKGPIKKTVSKKIIKDSDDEKPKKGTKKVIEDSDQEENTSKKATPKKLKKIEEIEDDEEEIEVVEKRIRGSKGRGKQSNDNLRERKGKCKPSSPDYCLEIRTPQTGVLKQAFERLGSVASDACIVFMREGQENSDDQDDDTSKSGKNKKKNTGGLRLIRMTEDNSVLIKMSLDENNFEHFYCEDPKITAGVDLGTLNSYIKTIDDDDPITIYMHRENRGSLFISTNSNDKREQTEIEINLMEIDMFEIDPPAIKFDNMITMASDKFNNTCKKISSNSSIVEITAVGSSIDFRGHNEGGRMVRKYQDTSMVSKKKKSDKVINGIYELRSLLAFSKCNKLCNTVQLYLLNEYPLVLIISVGTLGKMYVFMAPIETHGN